MSNAARLQAAIAAAIPFDAFDGVSIGDGRDRTTWKVRFTATATAQHRTAAQATIDAYVVPPDPTLDEIDTAALNDKLLEPGSIDRAELKTLFNHENRIRALEAKAPITQAQFVTALKAAIR